MEPVRTISVFYASTCRPVFRTANFPLGDRNMTIRELLAIATAPMLEVERTHHIVPSPQNLLRLSWALHSGGHGRCNYRSHNYYAPHTL
jgi:hypothetical protein